MAKHCMLVEHVAGCAAFCILGGGVGGGGGGGVVPLVGISRPPMTDAWQGPPASWGGHAYMHTWPAAWWITSTVLIVGGKMSTNVVDSCGLAFFRRLFCLNE